jgi:hypothetical protein
MLAPHEHEHGLRYALHAVAHHTGIPVLVVAAIALVVSWRLFRSAARLIFQVVVAVVVLLGLTHFGIIRW